MTDIDSVAVLNKLKDIVEGLPGMQNVQIGEPESILAEVNAWVAMASQRLQLATTETFQRDADFLVMFEYGVAGQEEDAELKLAAGVDALEKAILADKTLGGICDEAKVDATRAGTPDYPIFAGQEVRQYPVIVSVKQRGRFAIP